MHTPLICLYLYIIADRGKTNVVSSIIISKIKRGVVLMYFSCLLEKLPGGSIALVIINFDDSQSYWPEFNFFNA